MKKGNLLAVALLCGLSFGLGSLAFAAGQFSDVPENHWASGAIEWAANAGLVKGDEGKDTFRPNAPVTRAELVTVLERYNKMMMVNPPPNQSFSQMIEQDLLANETLEEIQNPNFDLPADIDEKQMENYFKMGEVYLAPVLQWSIARPFDFDEKKDNFDPNFAGLLVASEQEKKWHKLLQIKDIQGKSSGGNNPYYLWADEGKLMMSVVDGFGGASIGEGVEKVYATQDGSNWSLLEECYGFWPVGYKDEDMDGEGDFDSDIQKDGFYRVSSYLEKLPVISGTINEKDVLACEDDVELSAF